MLAKCFEKEVFPKHCIMRQKSVHIETFNKRFFWRL